MASNLIPFTGSTKNEQAIEDFLDVLDSRICLVERTYHRDERSIIRMKFLRTKLTGLARSFLDSQPSNVQEDWELATDALKEKFRKPDIETRQRLALHAYCAMKQRKLSNSEYIDRARAVFDDIADTPKWNNRVAVRMVTGLYDTELREIVKKSLGHDNYSLEEAAEQILALAK